MLSKLKKEFPVNFKGHTGRNIDMLGSGYLGIHWWSSAPWTESHRYAPCLSPQYFQVVVKIIPVFSGEEISYQPSCKGGYLLLQAQCSRDTPYLNQAELAKHILTPTPNATSTPLPKIWQPLPLPLTSILAQHSPPLYISSSFLSSSSSSNSGNGTRIRINMDNNWDRDGQPLPICRLMQLL